MPRPLRWAGVGAGWAAVAGLTIGCAGLAIDALRVMPGGPTGAGQPPFSAAAFLGRAACLVGAVVIARTTLRARRRLRDACPRCGRREAGAGRATAPRWATVAGYLTVAAWATRVIAEIITWRLPATPATPAGAASVTAFAVGMTLAGTLLPLALVYRWGRVWPRWVRPLAGRRVPRGLVLGPALFVSGGLTAIFGPELVEMLLRPPSSFGGFGVVFLWVAMTSYTAWGLALGVAAVSYFRRTRPACPTCTGPGQRRRASAGTSRGAAKPQISSAASNSSVDRSSHSGGTGVPGQV